MRLLFTPLLLLSVVSFSQAPSIEWKKSLGGSDSDLGLAFDQTTDGGYIVVGLSNSNDGDVLGNNGSSDYWLLKLDASGSILWQNSLGGSSLEGAYAVEQTSDGGYILTGFSGSSDGDVANNNGSLDAWVVKLNSSGSLMWEKSLGGTLMDYARSIQQTTDGGYILTGPAESGDGDISSNNGSSDYWVAKLDDLGNLIWERSLGGSNYDTAEKIRQTDDGGYIVVGTSSSNDGDVTGSHGSEDYWIVKLNASGNTIWQKSLGGSGVDIAWAIEQTLDGGYIVAGESTSSDGDVSNNQGGNDFWVVKLDTIGDITWERSVGGSGSDAAWSVSQSSDGGYIVAGESTSSDGDVTENQGAEDYWSVKLDTVGNIEWQVSFGGSETDIAYQMQETSDGGYFIVGSSNSNNGDVTGNHGSNDYWVIKLNPLANLDVLTNANVDVFPNPTSGLINLSAEDQFIGEQITIIDNAGRVMRKEILTSTDQIIDISSFSTGFYFLRIGNHPQPVKINKH